MIAEGPAHPLAVRPTNTMAAAGCHTAALSLTVTVIGPAVEGSVDWISTLVRSILPMPRASMAHMAYALAPPVIWTLCGVAVAENG